MVNLMFFLTPKSKTFYIDQDSTIRQVLEKMDYHKFTIIPVIDEEGHYITTLSEGDLLRFIKNHCDFDLHMAEEVKIRDIEKYRPYRALDINGAINGVMDLSKEQNFIPMVDDRGMYIGIVKRKDIIYYLYKRVASELFEKQQ